MGGIRVRGICRRCQTVHEGTAPAGKSTWRGPCPKAGCGGVIVARRVKETPAPAASGGSQPPAPDTPDTKPDDKPPTTPPPASSTSGRPRRKVVKVSGYTRTTGAGRSAPAGDRDTPPPGPGVRDTPGRPAGRPADDRRQDDPGAGTDGPPKGKQPARSDASENHEPRRRGHAYSGLYDFL